ncbi:MAG: translocation/assembly module TamB domain-containing protein [Pseudomonadota bacterium]
MMTTPADSRPPHQTPAQRDQSPRARLLRGAVIAIITLLILVIALLCVISALLSTTAGSGWVVRQVERQLDGSAADTRSLEIGSSAGTLLWGMTLQDVRFSEGSNTVSVQTLTSRWNPFTLLGGQLTLDELSLQDVRVSWRSAEDVNPDSTETLADSIGAALESLQTSLVALPFPLNRGMRFSELRLIDASLDLNGQALLINSLSLGASLESSRLVLEELALEATSVSATSQGATSAGATPPGQSIPLQLSGAGQIDLTAPHPLELTLDWGWEQALNTGNTNGVESPNALFALLANPSAQPGSVNDTLSLGGQLTLSGDLNTLIVSHQLSSPLAILSEGTVNTGAFSGGVSLVHRLTAQRQRLQFTDSDGGDLRVVVDSAEINTTGGLDALHLTGTTVLNVLNSADEHAAPPLTLSWNALLQGNTLTVDQLNASTASGSLSSNGRLSWADGLDLNISYSLREQDASSYRALLPLGSLASGSSPVALASTGSLTLQQAGETLTGTLAIDSLEGNLNDYPLSGGGVVSLDGGDYALSALRLAIGDNQLRASGRWSDEVALEFELQAGTLQNLSPQLAGSISASGSIVGPRSSPRLNLTATGNDIVAGAQRIDSLQLDLSGQPSAHRLTLTMQSPLGGGTLQFSGGLNADEDLRWQGQLDTGSLQTELGEWLLQDPVALQLSAAQVSVAQHCWRQAASALCLQGDWQSESSEIEAGASLSGYPLSLFNVDPQVPPSPVAALLARLAPSLPPLPNGTRFDGDVAAEININGRLSGTPEDLAIDMKVDLGTGQMTLVGAPLQEGDDTPIAAETQQFQWQRALLTGTRLNNRWLLDIGMDFDQPDLAATGISMQGSTRGRLAITPDPAITPDMRLDGQLTVAFDDLRWVQAFMRQVQISQGQLSGLATLSGTLVNPLIGGNLYLRDTAFGIPALGLQISALNTTVSSALSTTNAGGNSTGSTADGTLTLQGQARSGAGELRFESEVRQPFSPERHMTLTLQGENVDLIRRPELTLAITPDVTITASAAGVDINGLLRIPLLDARITTLPASAIDVSPDTVLVDQPSDGPVIHNAAQADRGILDNVPLTAQLRVELGDDVHFNGFGLNSQLTGALDITQRATGAPLTYGELTVVDGSYETYGRTLTIEHGKLLFFGSYDNPALDIRATRRAENMTVGVQMNGTLRNIRSQLFSTPTLPDGDIIAVLLTDRPFAEIGTQDSNALIGAITSLGINQGQSLTNQIRNQLGLDTLAITSTGDATNSSLTLGKYLTPRLFIRYGVGLFETESTLSIDYTLSERVKLEAKSGTTQSVDIKYTVDR